ncbi:conserved hypothetical protein [Ricinus communis]|uniref:Uncharacterized protein n=1 Tax=Ricinus communis TaxID=3988 RepID=B9RZ11_RICCO|nr:conserved hypothetical protein [Ricinus communis]
MVASCHVVFRTWRRLSISCSSVVFQRLLGSPPSFGYVPDLIKFPSFTNRWHSLYAHLIHTSAVKYSSDFMSLFQNQTTNFFRIIISLLTKTDGNIAADFFSNSVLVLHTPMALFSNSILMLHTPMEKLAEIRDGVLIDEIATRFNTTLAVAEALTSLQAVKLAKHTNSFPSVF